jgi:LPS-assembly lipoprotein
MARFPLLLLLAVLLNGCGFHLRGGGDLPAAMRRIYISGLPEQDLLRMELKSVLTRMGATVTSASDPHAIVLQLSAEDSQRNLSLNRTGLALEIDLGYKILYEIKTAKGEVIEPQQQLKFDREQYTDQFLIMGRSEETAVMRREMVAEAAEALVTRLAYLLKDRAAP